MARVVTGKVVAQSLDLGVRADAAAATGAVSLLDHLSAGIDSANNAAHDGDGEGEGDGDGPKGFLGLVRQGGGFEK